MFNKTLQYLLVTLLTIISSASDRLTSATHDRRESCFAPNCLRREYAGRAYYFA